MHPDEETLERLASGELPARAADSAREHLAACPACRARSAAASEEEARVHDLLRLLDHDPPVVAARDVLARSRRGRGRPRLDAPGSRDRPSPDRPAGLRGSRWAAGLLLALALAGAAYAVPGSPVPAWVERVADWIGGRSPSAVAPPPGAGSDSPPDLAGISVPPGDALVIEFTTRGPAGRARVSLSDAADVEVRAPAGAGSYTSDAGRLVIENADGAAVFEIRIPREAPRVEVRAGGERIFLKEGPRVTDAGRPGPDGSWLLALAPRRG